MHSFSVIGETRTEDGVAAPFNASVTAPHWEDDRFVSTLEWSGAGIHRQFSGPYAEAVYRRACAFVRIRLWRSSLDLLVDGALTEFMPPVFASSNAQTPQRESPFSFETVQLEGCITSGTGIPRGAMIRIGPPFRTPGTPGDSATYGCSCYFSEFGELGPILLMTTDDAYAASFRLVRALLRKRRLRFVDANGRPIAVTALGSLQEQ